MSQDITNILVCGIGGQGVMTATEILAEAAIAEGHDVKKTEVAGMAQRGGRALLFFLRHARRAGEHAVGAEVPRAGQATQRRALPRQKSS